LQGTQEQLDNKKEAVKKFKTEMGNAIVLLNNDIGELTKNYEVIEQEKNQLRSAEEEIRNKKWD